MTDRASANEFADPGLSRADAIAIMRARHGLAADKFMEQVAPRVGTAAAYRAVAAGNLRTLRALTGEYSASTKHATFDAIPSQDGATPDVMIIDIGALADDIATMYIVDAEMKPHDGAAVAVTAAALVTVPSPPYIATVFKTKTGTNAASLYDQFPNTCALGRMAAIPPYTMFPTRSASGCDHDKKTRAACIPTGAGFDTKLRITRRTA